MVEEGSVLIEVEMLEGLENSPETKQSFHSEPLKPNNVPHEGKYSYIVYQKLEFQLKCLRGL
jgi:hypothetical protein